MATVKVADTIRIHYVGRLDDGTVFDSTEGGASLELKVGEGEFLRALEDGVVGMSPGDSKTIKIDDAYGPRNEDMAFEFDRKKWPENFSPAIGDRLQMNRADGKPVMVTVVEIKENSYLLDCNHPLAGKNLTFEVNLEEIC